MFTAATPNNHRCVLYRNGSLGDVCDCNGCFRVDVGAAAFCRLFLFEFSVEREGDK